MASNAVAVATRQAVMPINCHHLATDLDMWADNRSAETQASCNAHVGVVHFQSDNGEWQCVKAVTRSKRVRGDKSGTFDVIGYLVLQSFGTHLAVHVAPCSLHKQLKSVKMMKFV